MMQISKIIGLDVLSKSDLKVCGTVSTVFFDVFCKKIAYFVAECQTDAYVLPYSAVRAVRDAVIVDDLTQTIPLNDLDVTSFCEVLGKKIYSADGELRGSVEDIFLDKKGKVAFLAAADGERLPYKIAGIGDFILIKDEVKTPKARRPRMPRATFDVPVMALDSEATAEIADGAQDLSAIAQNAPENMTGSPSDNSIARVTAAVVRPAETPDGEPVPIRIGEAMRGIELARDEDHIPPRIICDYNFLLSRTLTADLYSYLGELLAPKGSPVTVELVETARRHGKLIDLTLSSK